MRFHALRATFQRLVASAGLVTGAGRVIAAGCCPGIEPIEVTRTIDPRAEAWAPLVAACRASDASCTPLCKPFVGTPAAGVTELPVIVECFMVDRGRGATDVHVSYYLPEDCSAGRRPPGLVPWRPVGVGLGDWLAAQAHLEAASVPAFVMLAHDLVRHGAPPALVAAALAAADDEVGHARVLGALARAAGTPPPPVTIVATPPRDLPALALDNAVEGCVREAFAALVATHQAQAARDPALRRAFAAIAVDETRHAALAFALDAWLQPRLSAAARAMVVAARRAAFDELVVAAPLGEAIALAAGCPAPAVRARLLSGSRTILAAPCGG